VPSRVRRALVAAFASVAIVFTVGLAAAHTFVSGIRSAAREITDNGDASIATLSSMRGLLRQLEVGVNQRLAACGAGRCGPPPPRIAELQRDLLLAWDRYRRLPTFPGETEAWPEVDADLHRLGEAVALAFDAAERGEPGAARSEAVAAAFDRLDDRVARMVDLDSGADVALAARIDRLARLATVSTVALDLLTVALTALVAWLALRLVRRYEESLRERADELEQFAGRVAHDVKGPLTATSAALRALRRLSPDRASSVIDRGERAVLRVGRLVDDLLEFALAGGSTTRRASADVHDVVQEVVGELRDVADAQRVEVVVDGASHEQVACSPGVLESIVQNLVRNAIAYMGDSPVRVVRVRTARSDARGPVRIEVEDSGPGIPEELGERVFEPFVRGSGPVEGTGLGLATVKRFVSAHGGRVGFSATRGAGTLFWLEMPRSVSRPQSDVQSPPSG
jgi:signal transduction histidine kinase